MKQSKRMHGDKTFTVNEFSAGEIQAILDLVYENCQTIDEKTFALLEELNTYQSLAVSRWLILCASLSRLGCDLDAALQFELMKNEIDREAHDILAEHARHAEIHLAVQGLGTEWKPKW